MIVWANTWFFSLIYDVMCVRIWLRAKILEGGGAKFYFLEPKAQIYIEILLNFVCAFLCISNLLTLGVITTRQHHMCLHFNSFLNTKTTTNKFNWYHLINVTNKYLKLFSMLDFF